MCRSNSPLGVVGRLSERLLSTSCISMQEAVVDFLGVMNAVLEEGGNSVVILGIVTS